MCGLCGTLGTWLNSNEIERFQHLALTATFRGEVGGGVVVVPLKASKPPSIIKHPMSLAHLVLESEFTKAVHGGKDKRVCLLMGHARMPTRGGYETAALHPHVIHHIVGMHNGTFTVVRGKTIGKDDIDSREFFKHVAEAGIDVAIRAAEGAYALVWVDTRTETLNFLRNADRPIYIGYYKGAQDTIYWHSEYKLLHAIMDRDKDVVTAEIVIKSVPTDTLISFRTHNSSIIKPISLRTIPTNTPGVPLLPATKTGSSDDPLTMLQTMKGKYLTRKEITQIVTVSGCTGCANPSDMVDFQTGNMEWFTPREFMCHHCMYDDICLTHMAAKGHVPSYAAVPNRSTM